MSKKASMGTAVVTGASSGIGSVFAEKLAGRNFDLIIVARRGDRLNELAKHVRSTYDVSVDILVADLSEDEDLERVARVLEKNPAITLLVNNAGVSVMGAFIDANSAVMSDMLHVNVVALTRLALAVLPEFKRQNRGTLINIGSVLGYYGYPGTSAYSGTKAYVLSFTRGLQAELAGQRCAGAARRPRWDGYRRLGHARRSIRRSS